VTATHLKALQAGKSSNKPWRAGSAQLYTIHWTRQARHALPMKTSLVKGPGRRLPRPSPAHKQVGCARPLPATIVGASFDEIVAELTESPQDRHASCVKPLIMISKRNRVRRSGDGGAVGMAAAGAASPRANFAEDEPACNVCREWKHRPAPCCGVTDDDGDLRSAIRQSCGGSAVDNSRARHTAEGSCAAVRRKKVAKATAANS